MPQESKPKPAPFRKRANHQHVAGSEATTKESTAKSFSPARLFRKPSSKSPLKPALESVVQRIAALSGSGWLAEMEPSNRRLTLALAASVVLHAFVLMIHFRMPELDLGKGKETLLEVVLVNSKSARRPVDAHALAQANLDGGGNTDENRLATTPLPAADQSEEGSHLVEQHRRQREAEASSRQVMTRARSDAHVPSENHRAEQTESTPRVSGADLAETALAMARMEAAISKNLEEYNKRPRRKVITARTQEVSYAMYFAQWRDKVERVGNLNYPEEAKGKLYGSVVVVVSIRADGALDGVEIQRRSGHSILDEAAIRIVHLASPYGRFPDEMRRKYDVFDLVATVNFTKAEQVESSLSTLTQ